MTNLTATEVRARMYQMGEIMKPLMEVMDQHVNLLIYRVYLLSEINRLIQRREEDTIQNRRLHEQAIYRLRDLL